MVTGRLRAPCTAPEPARTQPHHVHDTPVRHITPLRVRCLWLCLFLAASAYCYFSLASSVVILAAPSRLDLLRAARRHARGARCGGAGLALAAAELGGGWRRLGHETGQLALRVGGCRRGGGRGGGCGKGRRRRRLWRRRH
eukprot:scaffold114354_cov39-Phaeocystis_antarctica.AAC.1